MSLFFRLLRRPDPAAVEKALALAQAGRKLAIFDPETGLFAPWYVSMRCTEECYRAARYERALSVLLVRPRPAQELALVRADVTDWLRRQSRSSDLAAYLGNGEFVVLMPETPPAGANNVARRLSEAVAGLRTGVSAFPNDGDHFEQLLDAASRALSDQIPAAA